MRLDKYLKVSRLIKRRTLAKERSSNGAISIDGRKAKPSSEVEVGDIIEIRTGSDVKRYIVKQIREYATEQSALEMYEETE